jgi:hypothetical protein
MPTEPLVQVAGDDKVPSVDLVIEPNEIRTLPSWTAALCLKKSCLGRECREGRLRYSKRAGRRWVFGKWIREWLEHGEVQVKPKLDATAEPKAVPATKRRRRNQEPEPEGSDQPAAA